ncbi:MAG: adenylosuccinate lyase [Candidatus Ancillula sp.]|nr:adenylosuccinate lyase [Candidatus Ancillula sp.]
MDLFEEGKLADGSSEGFVALSALDGRYRKFTWPLIDYLSEAALNRYRIAVELQYLIALSLGFGVQGFATESTPVIPGLPKFTNKQIDALLKIVADFDSESIQELARIESKTKHDVKAIEYYIAMKLEDLGIFSGEELGKVVKAIHIFCTSEDINNLSYALCIKGAILKVIRPRIVNFMHALEKIASPHIATPMLARTHGQPATPVTLGKELSVFIHRLKRQLIALDQVDYLGKLNGATGTFGAHSVALPEVDWRKFAKHFVEKRLNLTYNPLTTQIESHDWEIELFSRLIHINGILHNAATDIWLYISNETFIQIPEHGATGSSTMPHKINPIKFENAEANLEMSDAIFNKLNQTLVTTRMQRDLTDSSMQRNISCAFAHMLIALENLTSGIGQLDVNTTKLNQELENNPAVLGEAIQSVMRVAGILGYPNMENPYERLKEFSRGKTIAQDDMNQFISELELPDDMKSRLLNLTPEKYIGLSEELAREAFEEAGYEAVSQF